ncbi:MAG: hypothetical protein KA752_09875, partial [Giesbergeria sp.]|nr:hypothetical protein [Giesbergeria sp.]
LLVHGVCRRFAHFNATYMGFLVLKPLWCVQMPKRPPAQAWLALAAIEKIAERLLKATCF